jgi:hypothetical protein
MRATILLVALMATAGCDSPTAPTAAGEYEMVALDGAPLPHVVTWQGAGGVVTRTETGAVVLDLRADGTFTRTWHMTHTDAAGARADAYTESGTYTAARSGGEFDVTLSWDTDIGTGYAEAGVVAGGRLDMPTFWGVPAEYARSRP